MAGWYELKKTGDAQFHFVLKAGNGETILSSETYTAKPAALNGIASVQTNSPAEERYERKTAADGRFHFVLKAANHQVIGSSQLYTTAQARDAGIRSVQTNGPSKDLRDSA